MGAGPNRRAPACPRHARGVSLRRSPSTSTRLSRATTRTSPPSSTCRERRPSLRGGPAPPTCGRLSRLSLKSPLGCRDRGPASGVCDARSVPVHAPLRAAAALRPIPPSLIDLLHVLPRRLLAGKEDASVRVLAYCYGRSRFHSSTVFMLKSTTLLQLRALALSTLGALRGDRESGRSAGLAARAVTLSGGKVR